MVAYRSRRVSRLSSFLFLKGRGQQPFKKKRQRTSSFLSINHPICLSFSPSLCYKWALICKRKCMAKEKEQQSSKSSINSFSSLVKQELDGLLTSAASFATAVPFFLKRLLSPFILLLVQNCCWFKMTAPHLPNKKRAKEKDQSNQMSKLKN